MSTGDVEIGAALYNTRASKRVLDVYSLALIRAVVEQQMQHRAVAYAGLCQGSRRREEQALKDHELVWGLGISRTPDMRHAAPQVSVFVLLY